MPDGETRAPAPAISWTADTQAASGEAQAEQHEQPTDAGLIQLRSESELAGLAREIRDPQREHPVICLTARPGEPDPTLDPAAVREIVGPRVPIYFVGGRRLTRCLSGLLPPRLDVWDGATRVWWPGVSPGDNDPFAHPRIYDPSGKYGKESLERLAAEFAVRERPELTLQQRLVLSERQRNQLSDRAERLERVLANTRKELAQTLREGESATLAESQSASTETEPRQDAPQESASESRDENQLEVDLYKLIFSHWVDICSPEERAQRPPRRFMLSRELVRTISARRVDVPIERIAWVCAMVIADRAAGHSSINAHIYRGSDETVRGDGARAMRGALKRSAGGPRLHYWSLPNGTIEFTQIGYHDLSLPGEARKRG